MGWLGKISNITNLSLEEQRALLKELEALKSKEPDKYEKLRAIIKKKIAHKSFWSRFFPNKSKVYNSYFEFLQSLSPQKQNEELSQMSFQQKFQMRQQLLSKTEPKIITPRLVKPKPSKDEVSAFGSTRQEALRELSGRNIYINKIKTSVKDLVAENKATVDIEETDGKYKAKYINLQEYYKKQMLRWFFIDYRKSGDLVRNSLEIPTLLLVPMDWAADIIKPFTTEPARKLVSVGVDNSIGRFAEFIGKHRPAGEGWINSIALDQDNIEFFGNEIKRLLNIAPNTLDASLKMRETTMNLANALLNPDIVAIQEWDRLKEIVTKNDFERAADATMDYATLIAGSVFVGSRLSKISELTKLEKKLSMLYKDVNRRSSTVPWVKKGYDYVVNRFERDMRENLESMKGVEIRNLKILQRESASDMNALRKEKVRLISDTRKKVRRKARKTTTPRTLMKTFKKKWIKIRSVYNNEIDCVKMFLREIRKEVIRFEKKNQLFVPSAGVVKDTFKKEEPKNK